MVYWGYRGYLPYVGQCYAVVHSTGRRGPVLQQHVFQISEELALKTFTQVPLVKCLNKLIV